MKEPPARSDSLSILRSVGPAIITASVVLGPGSILSASKIGFQHGYSMSWVLLFAVVMMIGITALSARLGVVLSDTPCAEIARRLGRPAAAVVGISLFLIAACFQFGNNLGAAAALEPLLPPAAAGGNGSQVNLLVVVLLNVLVLVALFGVKQLYSPVERLMKVLVTLMIFGFAANLVMARPDLSQFIAGLVPRLPEGATGTLLPQVVPASVVAGQTAPARIVDQLTPAIAMFATTFSIAGAFYQAYLVRKKGWSTSDLARGTIDSTVGILILGLVTAMIMLTAAAVLHGNSGTAEPKSVADVARQLEPLFGVSAKALFCLGIFAGAFSSFLVNAMIGGTVLSDGLGLGGDLDGRWAKCFTAVTLIAGMTVALLVVHWGWSPVNLIVFAQAVTVLGFPALALSMLYLATRRDLQTGAGVPLWMKCFAFLAVLIALFLALRTAFTIYLKLTL